MYKILLCCSSALTTSMLVANLKRECEAQNIPAMIWACGETGVAMSWPDADIVLLAPQIRYFKELVQKEVDGKIPVQVIDGMDFSTLNAKNILKQAIDAIEENKGKYCENTIFFA